MLSSIGSCKRICGLPRKGAASPCLPPPLNCFVMPSNATRICFSLACPSVEKRRANAPIPTKKPGSGSWGECLSDRISRRRRSQRYSRSADKHGAQYPSRHQFASRRRSRRLWEAASTQFERPLATESRRLACRLSRRSDKTRRHDHRHSTPKGCLRRSVATAGARDGRRRGGPEKGFCHGLRGSFVCVRIDANGPPLIGSAIHVADRSFPRRGRARVAIRRSPQARRPHRRQGAGQRLCAARDRLRPVRPAAYRHLRRGRAHHHGAPGVPAAERRADAAVLLLRRHGRAAQGARQRAQQGDAGGPSRQAAHRGARSVQQRASVASARPTTRGCAPSSIPSASSTSSSRRPIGTSRAASTRCCSPCCSTTTRCRR